MVVSLNQLRVVRVLSDVFAVPFCKLFATPKYLLYKCVSISIRFVFVILCATIIVYNFPVNIPPGEEPPEVGPGANILSISTRDTAVFASPLE